MSEKTKATRIEVLKKYENAKGPHAVVCTDLDDGQEVKLRYWPTLKQGPKTVDNPACKMVVGGKYEVGLYYVDGRAGYDPEWLIKKCEPLAGAQDAREVFDSPRSDPGPESPQKPNPGFNKADFSMAAHNAYKYAAIMEQGFIVSMGHEAYLESGYMARLKTHANDIAAGIMELAKNGPDPFASE